MGSETFPRGLEVRKDPHSEGTLADIGVQGAALAAIRADIEAAGELINQVEWVRRQLLDARAVLDDRGDQAELVAAADSLNQTSVPRTSRARCTSSSRSGCSGSRKR